MGLLARWGGEEFLMVLPYDSQNQAKYVADEIREKVFEYAFEDVNNKGESLKEHISISLGIRTVDIYDTLNQLLEKHGKEKLSETNNHIDLSDKILIECFTKELFKGANTSLEYAKFMGRNRVEIFGEYLQSEVDNLSAIRMFYFVNSFDDNFSLSSVFPNEVQKKYPDIMNEIEYHFSVIKRVLNPRDTRTQAVFADKIYEQICKEEECKKELMDYFNKKLKLS